MLNSVVAVLILYVVFSGMVSMGMTQVYHRAALEDQKKWATYGKLLRALIVFIVWISFLLGWPILFGRKIGIVLFDI